MLTNHRLILIPKVRDPGGRERAPHPSGDKRYVESGEEMGYGHLV